MQHLMVRSLLRRRGLMACLAVILSAAAAKAQITIPAGSVIIDMGVNTASKPAGLRPYGMIHELVKFYKVPVLWVVRQGKVKDGLDYTIEGIPYRGGLFIISEKFLTSTINAAITGWRTGTPASPNGYTRGLVTARTTTAAFTFSGALVDTIRSAPNWTLDAQSGSIAAGFFVNAGIPATQYNWTMPNQLGACNDLFVMPHADPKWASHGNLFNWNLQHRGGIWLACHAGSALENMYNPANPAQQTNFLSTKATTAGPGIILPVTGSTNYSQNSLVLWGNHNAASIPYTTNASIPPTQTGTYVPAYDWVSQFIGFSNLAHQNGSEQVYLPVLGQGWRPTTKILTFDETQADIPAASPGAAVLLAYGRGLGDENRGLVMLSAGHSINRGTAGDVPAQRAFFNWSYTAVKDKAVGVGFFAGVPASGNIYGPISLSATGSSAVYASGDLTYTWTAVKKSDGTSVGSFSPNGTNAAGNTTFNPGSVASLTDVVISVSVSDPCGRTTTQVAEGKLIPPPSAPVAVNDAATISGTCYTPGASTTINVLNNDSDADGDLDSSSVLLVNPANSSQTGTTYTVTNVGTWTTNGTTVTFTPAENFFGSASINYRVCDKTPGTPLCATATITVGVGTADAQGCFPGSVYGVSTELGASTATVSTTPVSDVLNATGTPDFDEANITGATGTAATITNNTGVIQLDYGSLITGRDSISVYFGPLKNNNPVTITASFSTTGTSWTTMTTTLAGSNVSSNTALDIQQAIYDFPSGGLRYIRISKTGADDALVDAVVLEDWGCVSAQVTANNDEETILEDIADTLDVLANDDNPGNLPLRVTISQNPTKGNVSVNPNNTITYIGNRDSRGSDSYKYKICNSQGLCSEATVNINLISDGCASGQYTPFSTTTSTATFSLATESEDTYVKEDAATTNYGNGTVVEIGKKLTKQKFFFWRPLNFTTVIPSNAVIRTATFRVALTKEQGGGAFTVNSTLHRMTRSWLEGSATWNKFGSGASDNWTKPGGDFDSTVTYANLLLTNKAVGTNYTYDVKALLEYWQLNRTGTAPRPHDMGLVIKQTATPTIDKTVQFGSSENGTAAYKPLLTVTYQVPAACTTIPNRAPLGNPDVAATETNVAVNITNALVNDSDPDPSTTLSVSNVSMVNAARGAVSRSGNTITYTPNNSLAVPRTDTLLYTVSDGTLTDQAYIFVSVANAAPFIITDSVTGNTGSNLVVNVATNDVDPEGGALSNPVVVQEPKNGSYTISGTTFTYTPAEGFYGRDSLIYRRCETVANGCDATGLCDTTYVIFKVNNRAPAASDTTVQGYSCQSVYVSLVDLVSDPENEKVTINITSGTTLSGVTTLPKGTLTLVEYGIYVFKANNTTGTELINYTVTDPGGLTSTAKTITVNIGDGNTNQAPVAVDDIYDVSSGDGITTKNQTVYVDVLANDVEPDGQLKGVQLTPYPSGPALKQPTKGTVSVFRGQVLYTPNVNVEGEDEFEYVVYDSVPPVAEPGCAPFVRKYDIGLARVKINPLAPDQPIYLTGTVWHDIDYTAGGTFNNIYTGIDTSTNPEYKLYVYLINAADTIIDMAPVNPDGTYRMVGVPQFTSGLKILLTTAVASVGQIKPSAAISTGRGILPIYGPPPASLPSGWTSTTPTLIPAFDTEGNYIFDQDFGLQMEPETDDKTDDITAQLAVGQDYALDNFPLTGSDPEDSPAAGSISKGGRFIIRTLPDPADAELYYNGVKVTAGDMLIAYDSAVLTIRFLRTGVTTASFTYATVDSDSAYDQTPATYTTNLLTILPVSGMQLSAAKEAGAARLTWSTLTETNSSHFVVERSADGRTFSAIGGTVKAAGNSTSRRVYTYLDRTATGKLVYYRVKEVSNDGKVSISNTAMLRFTDVAAATRVFPNPANQYFTVEFGEQGLYQVELMSAAGQRLMLFKDQQTANANGSLTIQRAGLAAGTYLLKVTNKTSGEVKTFKLLLQER